MDEDFYIDITGRIRDMVIRGGENIYPREVEEFLYTHPGIEDVQIVGVPDFKYGEELISWINPKKGVAIDVESVKEFCTGNISHHKIPRYVEFTD